MRSPAGRQGVSALSIALVMFGVIGMGQVASAQETPTWPDWVQTFQLPQGWDTAPLADFLDSYNTLQAYSAQTNRWEMPEAHWAEVIDRAWVFLQDEQLLREGDWARVEELFVLFWSTGNQFSDDRMQVAAQRYTTRLAAEGDAVTGDYARLKTHLQAMRLVKVVDADKRARETTAAWLSTHNVSEVPAPDRVGMLQSMTEDLVPKSYFSARLSGNIAIPAAGDYSFSRYVARVPFHVDFMRVQIGDVIVLDTSPVDWNTQTVSGKHTLEAGTHPIVVEYVYNMLPRRHNRAELMLLWDTPGGDNSFTALPISAFTTSEGSPGLEMAYFRNGDLAGEPLHVETISGLQYLLSGYFGQRYSGILSGLKPTLTSPEAVAEWVGASGMSGGMYGWNPEVTLKHCTVEEVEAFVRILLDNHPEFVKQLRPSLLMMPLYYLLASDSELTYRLIETWGQERQRPVTRPARFELGAYSPYRNQNGVTSGKQWMLEGLTSHRLNLYEQIRDQLLTNSDGSCNLDVLKLLAASHPVTDKSFYRDLDAYIQTKIRALGNVNGSGDAVATWHIATAINTEYSYPDQNIRLLASTRPYELAFAVAESAQMRFWVFNEHAARLASIGDAERLEALIAAIGEGFNEEAQLVAIAAYRTVVQEVAAEHQAREQQAELDKLKRAYENLERRLQAIEEQGDQANIARYTLRRNQAKEAYDQAVTAAGSQ